MKPESATAGCHQGSDPSLAMFWRRQHGQSFDLSLSYGYDTDARYVCVLLGHRTQLSPRNSVLHPYPLIWHPCPVAANAGRRSGTLLRIGSERFSVDALFSTLLEGIGAGCMARSCRPYLASILSVNSTRHPLPSKRLPKIGFVLSTKAGCVFPLDYQGCASYMRPSRP